MIRVRRAETDADLQAWRQMRIAVVPTERTATVAELRRTLAPEQLGYETRTISIRVRGDLPLPA